MGRSRRRNLPGVAFHLTARIQGGTALLKGLEKRSASLIKTWAANSDFCLVAYAIMPNHLHIIAVQGQLPLQRFMQPALSGISQSVIRAHSHRGHVFECRYYDKPCLDAEYLRNAIAYVHLNPVRAGLCSRASDYEWSSHGLYRHESADWPRHRLQARPQRFGCSVRRTYPMPPVDQATCRFWSGGWRPMSINPPRRACERVRRPGLRGVSKEIRPGCRSGVTQQRTRCQC